MVKVIFKNLQKSDMVREIVTEKVQHVLSKFPDLKNAAATVFVEMENSLTHPGKDDFRIKLIMASRGNKPVVIQKESDNFYQAASVLADRLFDVLHRYVEKRRDTRRHQQRRSVAWQAAV